MLLSETLKNVELCDKYIPEINVEKITAKPELIEKNTLFVLLKETNSDREKIINDIQKRNPAAIITDKELKLTNGIPIIKVRNARQAYAMIAYNLSEINKTATDFYAITGTNGKTTTATMLYKIFTDAKIKTGFIGTGKIIINEELVSDERYSMTTPDPELLYPIIKRMQKEGCKKIVMEVSSHSLALYKVSPLFFEFSLFTNLSEEHLDFHKSIEDYYNAKLSLFQQTKNGIFNLDDIYSKRAMFDMEGKINTYSVGIKSDAEAMAKEVYCNGVEGSSYIYREAEKIFKISLSIGGEYNVSNSLLATKCALLSGVSTEVIKRSLADLKIIEGRMETVTSHPTVIIDYAHTPAALKKILFYIKRVKKDEQNIITVFGCGGERDTQKRPKMAKISEEYSDYTIVTSDNSRGEKSQKIIVEIECGFSKNAKYEIIENRKTAIEKAIYYAKENDIVLIIGKGHERYNIDDKGYHPFDERAIILAAQSRKLRLNENKNQQNANT